jgi:predicted O-linked N-acetylglucosamine transferase (SPINDLY family)
MRLLGAADVMLDPIHFGGSNTTLGGFAAGTPVVTWPGPYMRGRMTYGLYRTMGVTDCIATDLADYAAKAVEIANDPGRRDEIARRIRTARPAVVETAGASRDLGNLLAEAVSSRNG